MQETNNLGRPLQFYLVLSIWFIVGLRTFKGGVLGCIDCVAAGMYISYRPIAYCQVTFSLMAECNLLQTLKRRKAKYYNITLNARSCKQVCSGKAIYMYIYIYSECVFVTLNTQRAMLMHSIVICVLPTSTTFSTLFHKWHDFRRGGKLLNMKFVF